MKKCWYSQVIALSTVYAVLHHSEEFLMRHSVMADSMNDSANEMATVPDMMIDLASD